MSDPHDDLGGVARPHALAALDHQSDAEDVVRWAFLSRLLDGTEPFTATAKFRETLAPEDLLPHDARQLWRSDNHYSSRHGYSAYARDTLGGYYVRTVGPTTPVTLTVSASSQTMAAEMLDRVRERAPQPPKDDRITLVIWHRGEQGPSARPRRIDAPRWAGIERNYAAKTRKGLRDLIATKEPDNTGRLILWHGAPGTGKTTALRAFAREWSPWCSAHYVPDAERLFADVGYLQEVALEATSPLSKGPSWRLIIAEDSDEYLRSTARREAGAALGRLLNLTDGMLGQGTKTLVLLTTNEPLSELHPALVRPGRCLAEVEFTTFSSREAQEWLGAAARPPGPSTLAELLEIRGDLTSMSERQPSDQPAGMYL